jgi:hypothetical protein
METDQPIINISEDYLKRDRFVNAVARHINSFKDKECVTFGIYGKWGAGKTSVINLIREQLKSAPYYHFTIVFTPWLYKSEDLLLHDLFLQIIKGCNSDEKLAGSASRLGKLLKKYSKAITLPKINFMGLKVDPGDTAKNLMEAAGDAMDGEETIEDYRDKINDILRVLAVPMIIFIDDIDRLDRKELQTILKIIKLTANFHNIRYVLSYDEDFVAKSVASVYGDGSIDEGRRFLEKIIQVPLKLPETDVETRLNYTTVLINTWLTREKLIWDQENSPAFFKVFRRKHEHLITTPRDSKRLMNVVSFSEISLNEEINIQDLILVEAIRLYVPKLFRIIADNRNLFVQNYGKLSDMDWDQATVDRIMSNYPGKDNVEELKRELAVNENVFETVTQAIKFLFPNNAFFQNTEGMAPVRKLGIGRYEYLVKYLEFRIGEGEIPDKIFKEALIEINGKTIDQLSEVIATLTKFNDESVYGKVLNNIDQLTETGKLNVAKLIMTLPFFFEKNIASVYFTHHPQQYTAQWLLSEVKDEERRFEAIRYIIDHCSNYQFASNFLANCYNGLRYENSKIIKIEPEDRMIQEIRHFFKKVLDGPAESWFRNVRLQKNNHLFQNICFYGDKDLLKVKIAGYINIGDDNVLAYMRSVIREHYFQQPSIFGHVIEDADFMQAEEWAERNLLRSKLIALFGELQNADIIYEDDDKRIAQQYLRFAEQRAIKPHG